MAISHDTRAARAHDADITAQEQAGATAAPAAVLSPGHIRAVSPVHGEPVLFVPGEMLPDWAAELMGAEAFTRDDAGVYTLTQTRTGKRTA